MSRCVGKDEKIQNFSKKPLFADVEPPTIVCPHNGTIESGKNLYYATASWGEPESTGNELSDC